MNIKKTSKYNLSDGEEDDLDIYGGVSDDFNDEVGHGSDEDLDHSEYGSMYFSFSFILCLLVIGILDILTVL